MGVLREKCGSFGAKIKTSQLQSATRRRLFEKKEMVVDVCLMFVSDYISSSYDLKACAVGRNLN